MKRFKSVTIILLLATALIATVVQGKQASVLLQDGRYAEETEGGLDAAIKIYEQIIADSSAQRPHVAEAMYRLGMCHLKKQNEVRAKSLFEKIVTQYADQQEVMDKVQPLLDEMTSPDPAALMPVDTKVYLEIGDPGRQIETLLKMLQGTPLANPLAMIGGGGGEQKGPGDMIGALLNPSMMAEFKKIKGCAIGITDIQPDNPTMIAVLYPGKSDALRGILQAALGMAGEAGEPIEDMQVVTMYGMVGAAYDNSVVLVAQPVGLLEEVVKKYKGLSTRPSLGEANKMFSKLSRKIRQRNALTLWVDSVGTYEAILQQVGDVPQLQLVNEIADLDSVEDIVVSLVLEENGISSETIINFEEGQDSLAYGLIRTPALQREGFASIPADAVAVFSIALGESNGQQAEIMQKKVKQLTGLDIGREIFANIEQINLFAVAPRSKAGDDYGIADALACVGVSVTSKNPAQTWQLFGRLLGIVDLAAKAATGAEESEQPAAEQSKYFLGELEGRKIHCHLGQTGKTTVIAFDRSVVAASISGLKKGESALTAGVLRDSLNRLEPTTNKLVLVNVGGAIRIADEVIKAVNKNPHNPGHKLMVQLAEACDKTTIKWYTSETDTTFRTHSSLNDIPALSGVFGIVMQLSQYDLSAKAKATRPSPPDGATLRVDAEVKLEWRSGAGAASHKVYFGTEADELSLLSEVDSPDELELPALKEDVTYYWRVDEVRQDGSEIKGDVWSFEMSGKLLGWWKMDETSGTRAADSSGRGNVGTVRGNGIWQRSGGKIAGAIELDGDGDFIEISNESNFDVAGQLTVSVWVKVNEFDKPFQSIISKGTGEGWILSRSHSTGTVEFVCKGVKPQPYVVGKTSIDNGQWHHLAGVYDGGKLKLYVDGKLDGSKNAWGSIVTNDYSIYIGNSSQESGRFFDGLIDDVRIYNYALSEDEVKSLYEVAATEPQPADGGVTGPSAGLRPSWKPASGAASHKVYFGSSADGLTLLAEVKNSGDAVLPKLEQNNTYYWRVDEVMADGSVTSGNVWSFTTSGKLVGWWKLDETEGRDVVDSSGNNNFGKILEGSPKWQPSGGKIGGALLFDGKGDFINIANESNFDFTNQMTVAAWVKVNSVNNWWQAIVTKGDSAWRFHHYEQSGRVAFHATGLTTPNMQQHGGPAGDSQVTDGQWHHVAAVYGGGKGYIYVDGQLDDEIDMAGTIGTNNEPVMIGENSQQRGRYFNGMIDEVRVYDYALSAGEVSELAKGG